MKHFKQACPNLIPRLPMASTQKGWSYLCAKQLFVLNIVAHYDLCEQWFSNSVIDFSILRNYEVGISVFEADISKFLSVELNSGDNFGKNV